MGEIRRSYGTVRQLGSGRYQARHYGADGLRRVAPYTFDTRRKAEKWLVGTEAEILRGDWVDPEAGSITFGEYAKRWVAERDLKARTREEYERHLRLHLLPYLGDLALSAITSGKVRTWRTDRLVGGVGRSTVARRTASCTRSS